MTHVTAWRESANRGLRASFDSSHSDQEFFAFIDRIPDRARLEGPSIDGSLPGLQLGNSETDLTNCITIYSAMPSLSRVEASDSRLWNRLATVEYRSYMQHRWGPFINEYGSGEESSLGRLLAPTSITNPRQLTRHGVARLWWFAYLLDDPALDGPLSSRENDRFAYLRFVLNEGQDAISGLLERRIGTIPGLALLALEVAEAVLADTDPESYTRRQFWRTFYRQLQALSGHTAVAILPSAAIAHPAMRKHFHDAVNSLASRALNETVVANQRNLNHGKRRARS